MAQHNKFEDYSKDDLRRPGFSDARSGRNAVERCRYDKPSGSPNSRTLTKDDLITLTEQDVYRSGVFGNNIDDVGVDNSIRSASTTSA